MIADINNYIQSRMQSENLSEVPLVIAAKWLDKEGILKDSKSSVGYSLRRHVYRGNVFGAYKKDNYYWYIKQISNFDQLLTIHQLLYIFDLKNRTSVYRKIKFEKIPYIREYRKGIYFKHSELLDWALEKKRDDVFEKLKKLKFNFKQKKEFT